MTRVKSLSKVNRKGQGKYMLIWSIFFRKKDSVGGQPIRDFDALGRAHENQVRENHYDGAEEEKEEKNDSNINVANSNPFP